MAAEIKPRNRRAAARGARTREMLRQLMLEHAAEHPLTKPLTGKQLQIALRARGIYLALSTVLWHVSHIRLQADIEALDVELRRNCSNSSDSTQGIS